MTDFTITTGPIGNYIITTPEGERIPCHNLATAKAIVRSLRNKRN